jgi:hypothetical protein
VFQTTCHIFLFTRWQTRCIKRSVEKFWCLSVTSYRCGSGINARLYSWKTNWQIICFEVGSPKKNCISEFVLQQLHIENLFAAFCKIFLYEQVCWFSFETTNLIACNIWSHILLVYRHIFLAILFRYQDTIHNRNFCQHCGQWEISQKWSEITRATCRCGTLEEDVSGHMWSHCCGRFPVVLISVSTRLWLWRQKRDETVRSN